MCSQGEMVYASDRISLRKLLGDLSRPMTMSAEDDRQIHIASERSHGDAMARKLAGRVMVRPNY